MNDEFSPEQSATPVSRSSNRIENSARRASVTGVVSPQYAQARALASWSLTASETETSAVRRPGPAIPANATVGAKAAGAQTTAAARLDQRRRKGAGFQHFRKGDGRGGVPNDRITVPVTLIAYEATNYGGKSWREPSGWAFPVATGGGQANYSAGNTTSTPFFFRRITMNFAGSVVLALRPTVCTSLGPS